MGGQLITLHLHDSDSVAPSDLTLASTQRLLGRSKNHSTQPVPKAGHGLYTDIGRLRGKGREAKSQRIMNGRRPH